MKIRFTFFFFSAICLIACIKSVNIQSTSVNYETVRQDSILFLAFKIFINNQSPTGQEIKLVSSQKVKGSFKVPLTHQILENENHLTATFFDFENNEINVQIIENPLNEPIEFVNDKGEFERRKIDKKEADLFLRVNYQPKISHVIFSNGPKNRLASINLNPF